MPSSPEPPVGSSAELPPTAPEGRSADATPRDTVRTGPPQHSTLPPESPLPSAESSSPDSDFAPVSVPLPQPASGVQDASRAPALDDGSGSGSGSGSEADHNTLHSASHPGSGAMTHWDERRVVHLEHEFDQLSARQRLLDKRLDELSQRLRWFLAGGLVAALLSALWWSTRG